MRARVILAAIIVSLVGSPTILAKDVYLSVAGSVGVFRTDTRIFNPSGTKEIVITAAFLPVGQDNSGVTTKQVNLRPRQMLALNDVVSSLFNASGLGAIRLSSPDDFLATSRIYATSSGGTLGQFVPGLESSAARTKGVLLQLAATGSTGQSGTYRTNMGFVNPNATATSVTLRRYGANDVPIGDPVVQSIPPFSVIFPVVLDPAAGNLTDAWVSFEATQPILGFASVVDNGTTDPTFIPAFEDTGTTPGQSGTTKLYISPLLNFKLNPTPSPVTGSSLEWCVSSSDWTTTLAEDMVGTSYRISLAVKTSFNSSGSGTLLADIIHKRGSVETKLASATFTTTSTYTLKTVDVTGPDPSAMAGDTLLLRVRIQPPGGLPCVAEFVGPGTDNFIEVPKTSVSN